MTFLIVLLGWMFSLTLHEFSHAFVAYRGGDFTVREKGYLTFNPLKYTHPVYSLLLPILFLFMGGIGLPGGAVYIETWRLRSRKWATAVSLAGPLSNILVAIILGLILRFGPATDSGIWPGLSFLALLQLSAAAFNLLPIPPFDGYGAIRPHLGYNLREKMDAFGQVSMWVVLLVFWYLPFVGSIFWRIVSYAAQFLGISLSLAGRGYDLFQFWK
ncbi:MAG: site-2 protease family protein [Chloroflexi bacterium]|nr:MAG: site-2 protease family protein [Chloroflexota bacterium]RPH63366.1 MAG: site-2 protease family protein [Chloroflexota bacterium]